MFRKLESPVDSSRAAPGRPTTRHDFASDTVFGLAPEALEALRAANVGTCVSYGSDETTARTADAIRERFDCDAEIRFVTTGTAANAIALSLLARPFESVLAHESAHAVCDEIGAPALFGHGIGFEPLPGTAGKIGLSGLEQALRRPKSPRRQPPAALSLTNATEYGDVYSDEDFEALVGTVKSFGLRTHLDGARLANAAAAGFDLKRLARLGVDIATFGGSKAGAGMVEALVFFDRALAEGIDYRLKQAGQLVAKSRLMTAPLLGLLESGAWERGAAHANRMAAKLADAIRLRTPFTISHPVSANMVFVRLDDAASARLGDRGWIVHQADDGGTRFVTSWATTSESVEELVAALIETA